MGELWIMDLINVYRNPYFLSISWNQVRLATPNGLEPLRTESKSVMLPLHYRVFSFAICGVFV